MIYFDLATFLFLFLYLFSLSPASACWATSLINFGACSHAAPRCWLCVLGSCMYSCILQFGLLAIYLFIKFYTISRGRLTLSHHILFALVFFEGIFNYLFCVNKSACSLSLCVYVGAAIKMAHIIMKA